MKMNDYVSRKLKILSFFSILMVIFIHMYYAEGDSYIILNKIECIVGQRLCTIAVPLFFLMSGYLFFLKMPNGVYSIKDKLKKRVRTLLIPYIIANTLSFIFYLVLNFIALKIPYIAAVVNFRILDVISAGIWPIIKLVFLDPPIAYQLWFIRDLMVVMVFSPAIWLLLRYILSKWGRFVGVILLVALLCYSGNGYIQALLWFTLGGYFAMHPSFSPDRKYSLWIGCSCLLIMMLLTLAPYDVFWLTFLIPVFGIPAIWILFDYMALDRLYNYSYIKDMCSYTFFIYLVHEPLLNIFKKLPLLFSRSELTLLISYFIIPLVFVFIFCQVGSLFKKFIPRLYSIYTGGR